MKKFTTKLIALCLALTLVSCGKGDIPDVPNKENPQDIVEMPNPQPNIEPKPQEDIPFQGKIAIVTSGPESGGGEFESAQDIQAKYGEDKIIHKEWPVNFAAEGEMMIKTLQEIAADEDVRALILTPAVLNTNAAVEKFRELRDDVFIVYSSTYENYDDVAARADLILMEDSVAMGKAMVEQAFKMGAKTFAHYSFPRHMEVPMLSMQRDQIKLTCEEKGIRFENLTCQDPVAEGGMPAAQEYITQDVPRQVERLGKDTAFFATNCGLQVPLIAQIVETGAIYPQPCCPSPYHGFPTTLGISAAIPTGEFNEYGEEIMRPRTLIDVIQATRDKLEAKGMSGRLSTWPAPSSTLYTHTGVEYAIEWINGNVPKLRGNIDLNVLSQIYREQILEISGENVGVTLSTYDEDDVQYSHFVLLLQDYITY